MKILFVIPSLDAGGAERTVVNLAAYLAGRGYTVGALTIKAPMDDFYTLDSRVERIALSLAGINHGWRKLTSNLWRLVKIRAAIAGYAPDVVVGMMPYCGVFSILAAIGLSCKVVAAERNNPARQAVPWIWALLRKGLYGCADAVVAQTEQTRAWMTRHFMFMRASKITVIPNSVHWPLQDLMPRLRPNACVSYDCKVIMAAGRICHQKGHDLLIAAFAKIAQKYPDWTLVILGEAEAAARRRTLEKQVADAGLADRVLLPGRAGNIAEWFARADIFALSSRYEGFPNVLLEAMAAGCACISFDCDTGPREIIRHETDGLLAPPENTDAMAAGLERLMHDEELRKKLAARAVESRVRFAPGRILTQWEALFKRLLPATGL